MLPAQLDEHALLTLMGDRLLPHLMQHRDASVPVRIWSIGCQVDDEALLLLLRLVSAEAASATPLRFTLFATDPDAHAVSRARRLASSDQLQTHASLAPYRQRLEASRNGLALPGTLRESLIFGPHDLLKQVPFSHAMRNEHVEEVVSDPAGENDAKPDAAFLSGGRTNRRGSERGKK